jgi:hypothetical protein
MQSPRGNKPTTPVSKNSAVNSVNAVNYVNRTTGGAIFMINGLPATVDYQGMTSMVSAALDIVQSSMFAVYSESKNDFELTLFGTESISPAPSLDSGKPTSSILPELLAAIGNDSLNKATINDVENTTGGIIALVNILSPNVVGASSRTSLILRGS